MTKFSIIIPARFGSARLPGKPLLDLCGKPMILHVVDRAREAGASNVVVATDDERIANVVAAYGCQAMMTAAHHVSGLDRLAEVVQREARPDDEVVINLQGDEPMMPAALLVRVAECLDQHSDAGMATVATPIRTSSELWNPNVVKLVLGEADEALYFSRAPIPWVRDAFRVGSTEEPLPQGTTFLRHLGLYGYRAGVVRQLARTPPHALELAESLEQLRALATGIRIRVITTHEALWHGVDTEGDLLRVRSMLSGPASG